MASKQPMPFKKGGGKAPPFGKKSMPKKGAKPC